MTRSGGAAANPYQTLEPRAFWAKGVAEGDPLATADLYRPKYRIAPTDRVSTAGSCFAQHIGRHMRERDFFVQDFEPSPPYLSEEDKRNFGYGIYSARYGNIYTVRQLLQLIQRAFGKFRPVEDVWTAHGRAFDPFRPAIEPNGFRDLAEFETMRGYHFDAVQRMFLTTDVFVFTLGLTEAWVSKADGAVFPMCPGTIAGEFSSEKHEFRNFSFPEIYGDMQRLLAVLKAVNPKMRLLLTVSPVPLTATASGQHVVVATAYSKATLRAVAGAIASEHPNVDYFPSYEIITSPAARGMFFERNLRTVTATGVSTVMREFFRWHQPEERTRAAPAAERADPAALVCEESRLERAHAC